MTVNSPMRPHFRDPPIHEQVISLVFDRVQGMSATDFGLFFADIRKQFPNSDTVARVAISTEFFEGEDPTIQLEMLPPVVMPRVLYRSESGEELIQVQDDFFAFNWISVEGGNGYPRFELTSGRLHELFDIFRSFMAREHSIEIKVRQAEITNVNIIPVASFGIDYDDIADAFNVDPFKWDVPGLQAETYVRQRVHRIIDDYGKPIGRLHSVITPVMSALGEKAFKFEITARSVRREYSDGDLTEFLGRAHTMINGAFIASVHKNMRERWGEYHGD